MNVFLALGSLSFDEALKMWFRVPNDDEDNYAFHLTGYFLTSAAQYAVSHHNRKSALLTHDQLAGHQDFQGLSLKAAFKPVRPVLLQGVIPLQLLLNFMRFLLVRFFQHIEIPLEGNLSLQHIKYSSQFGVIHKLTEGAFHLFVLAVIRRH